MFSAYLPPLKAAEPATSTSAPAAVAGPGVVGRDAAVDLRWIGRDSDHGAHALDLGEPSPG